MMNPRVLRETKDEISYSLFLIFNKCLQLGILPNDCKLAEVTAIHQRWNWVSGSRVTGPAILAGSGWVTGQCVRPGV